MRLRARPNMPAAVRRIRPLPVSTAELHTNWACNLKHRTGWYGLKTRKHGVLLLFTVVMDKKTHYINLENIPSSSSGVPRCIVDTTVCINDLLYELPHPEELLADDEVTATWEFTVKGPVAGPDGGPLPLRCEVR